MKKKSKWFFLIPFVAAAVAALLGGAVMLLWNSILPPVTGVKALTYPQAVGLLILCRILFGSFRPGRPGFRRGGPPWREKLMNMSEEERQKFREEWRSRRFGHRPPKPE